MIKVTIEALLIILLINTFQSVYGQLGNDCRTPSGANGECSYLDDCSSLLLLTQEWPIPQNSRNILSQSKCGEEDGQDLLCCPKTVSNIPSYLPDAKNCGLNTADRIFGGKETKLDEFPWMALLKYKNRRNKVGTMCGGALISSRYVLTAAHCIVNDPRGWRLVEVILGEHNLLTDPDCIGKECAPSSQTYVIESYTVHENYNQTQKSIPNDIALIRLTTPVTFTFYIQPICLPQINPTLRNRNFVGNELSVAGWGKTETSSISDVKLQVTIPIKQNTECNTRYRTLGIRLTDKQMCAGGGAGACRGDSGGPLMSLEYNDKKKANWYIIGIVSLGPTPCDTTAYPGIYTKVEEYNDWILRNVRE